MRAAAILGLGSSAKDLKRFQKNCPGEWIIGLPASSSDADIILIFGGDGTVHRHLRALVDLQLPVLVVPCGSGNDFARALNIRGVRGSLAAWKKFVGGAANVRAIDLGRIAPCGTIEGVPSVAFADEAPALHAARNTTYFGCAGGVGLDGEISRRANELPRWLRGHGGYWMSLLLALARFVPVFTRVLTPQLASGVWETRSAKPVFVAAFANTPAYGGGMKIAPTALLDDGKLDVCIVSDIDKFKLFCLFPTVYFGRHLKIPEVEYFQAAQLRIETEIPLDVYADGEFVCRTPIEVSVAPQVLQVVTG